MHKINCKNVYKATNWYVKQLIYCQKGPIFLLGHNFNIKNDVKSECFIHRRIEKVPWLCVIPFTQLKPDKIHHVFNQPNVWATFGILSARVVCNQILRWLGVLTWVKINWTHSLPIFLLQFIQIIFSFEPHNKQINSHFIYVFAVGLYLTLTKQQPISHRNKKVIFSYLDYIFSLYEAVQSNTKQFIVDTVP